MNLYTTEELIEELASRFEYFALGGVLNSGHTYRYWKFGERDPHSLPGFVGVLQRTLELKVLEADQNVTEDKENEPWKYTDDDADGLGG